MPFNLSSFLRGFGSVLSIAPPPREAPLSLPTVPKTAEEAFAADAAKLAGDRQRVGDDLRIAMRRVDAELARAERRKGRS